MHKLSANALPSRSNKRRCSFWQSLSFGMIHSAGMELLVRFASPAKFVRKVHRYTQCKTSGCTGRAESTRTLSRTSVLITTSFACFEIRHLWTTSCVWVRNSECVCCRDQARCADDQESRGCRRLRSGGHVRNRCQPCQRKGAFAELKLPLVAIVFSSLLRDWVYCYESSSVAIIDHVIEKRFILQTADTESAPTDQTLMRKLPEAEKAKIQANIKEFVKEKELLDIEISKWDESSNDIIVLAKSMCVIMMDMTDFTRGRGMFLCWVISERFSLPTLLFD